MKNMINWFEIPVADYERARKFYEILLGEQVTEMPMPGMRMGAFPGDENSVSGGIVQGDGYIPGASGVTIYLNANPNLSAMLGRVEAAGGRILLPKTPITPEHGFFAFFLDTEGNKIGLHSQE